MDQAAQQALALMMATHARLGEESPARKMPVDCARRVMTILRRQEAEEAPRLRMKLERLQKQLDDAQMYPAGFCTPLRPVRWTTLLQDYRAAAVSSPHLLFVLETALELILFDLIATRPRLLSLTSVQTVTMHLEFGPGLTELGTVHS